MSDWLSPFLSATPWMAWFFLGIGLPWALTLLPRRDWQDWPLVAGLGLATGPLLGTTWLFLLGTFGSLNLPAAFGGTLLLALAGAALAWRRRHVLAGDPPPDDGWRFPALTAALLVMMGLTLAAIAWDAAFWPFIRYDTLWTFGYNPKVFMLHGHIPDFIDYYPQLVPLTFTFADLGWGAHNDHAAKAAVPWFIAASGLAAYLFGWRVFQRRLVGLVTAGLWMLLPSSAAWASSGDLEHPMAIYFTLATLFFILAWREAEHQRRYALLSGLMLAGAMWAKPTSGAFVIGMGVVLAGVTWRAYQRGAWDWFHDRLRLMIGVGLVAAPIGGMWYIRNILLGHAWTNLPASHWTNLAQRSGLQLLWPLVIAALVASALALRARRQKAGRQAVIMPLLGFALLAVTVLPTVLSATGGEWTGDIGWAWINGLLEPARRLSIVEFALLVVGSGLLIHSGRDAWGALTLPIRQGVWLAVALMLPFFLVYFWSFSYHYRLALTVMPILFSFVAALLVGWAGPFLTANRLRRAAVVVVVIILGLLAPVSASFHTLKNVVDPAGVRSDHEKYTYANPALMWAVDQLEDYAAAHGGGPLAVSAPGENRLAFFFPTWTIDDEMLPTDVQDLAGYDLLVEVFAKVLWRLYDMTPNQVMAWMELAYRYPQPQDGPHGTTWPKVLVPVAGPFDDGNNRYEIFETHAGAAFVMVEPENPLDGVVFNETMQLVGYDLSAPVLRRGETFEIKFYWQGTQAAPPRADYSIFVHFLDPTTGQLLDQRDGGLMGGAFPTRLLTPGMVFQDRREWVVPDNLPPGPVILRVGVYLPDGPRLPVTVQGQDAGDGVVLQELVVE